jgi:hypothetical protein
VLNKGVGGEEAGSQVAEGAEFFSELQNALFRADLAGSPFLQVSALARAQSRSSERTGPPTAPRMMASAAFAAAKASSVSGLLCASMEHCR